MVKTRSGDGTFEKIDDQMPVKVVKSETAAEPAAEDEEATASSQPHESSEEKDLTYSPTWGHQSKISRRGYRRSVRSSTSKGMSSRSRGSRYVEDDMDESRDDMMSDDSEIFPRQRNRRGQRESLHRTRVSSHRHHVSRRLQIRQAMEAEVNGDKDTPEGGVRRSTRMRKQKYDSYNNTWIDGMNGHHSLRGYPSMFPDEKKPSEDAAADSEEKPDEPQEKVYVYNSDPKEASEEEEEEQIVRPRKRSRTIAEMNTTTETLESGNDLDMDMYSRVKRMHRPTKRYMFDDDKGTAQADVDQTSQTSTDEETEEETKVKRRTYSLRKTKPTIDRFQATIDPPRKHSSRVMRSMLRRRDPRFGRSRSSSSSSSEDERFETRHKSTHAKSNKSLSNKSLSNMSLAKSLCLPTPINQSCPGETTSKPAASNLADVDPMSLDRSIMFAHVGGLEEHIRCLKEMVVFPMLYPEVFDRFHIQPAKGVLFHGLPGTGKTLLARALANECSQGARKVAFFMRKGADCLTKWVGESERQLRLLFDQAYQMRPSIIFFDEIDGLAPVRSSKQDQIHASIVSTLLALMDGLDSRGEVIVIGATNRVDAIDPALRRPGRFDRELYFPLPARKERLEILQIHVSKWEAPPSTELLATLAGDAAGYCGSDLRALCSEAVLRGLRRRYPQIYASSRKLLLDPQQVTVEREDFARARASIVPAASRGCPGATRNHLSASLRSLLGRPVDTARRLLGDSFLSLDTSAVPAAVRWPRLLVSGDGAGHGQAQVASALLGAYEHVPVHTLDLTALFRSSSCTPEEACIQVLNEARRNPPSVILAAGVDRLWSLSSETLRAVFLSKLRELEPAAAVLLLATADCVHDDLPVDLAALFSPYRDEVLTLSPPDSECRESFFLPVFLEEPLAPPPPPPAADAGPLEELPLAPPPPPPKLTEEQLRQTYEREEATLRELRIFLRDCCSKLARNRLFFMFTKPVDIEEVPDYLTIIAQPMDLETIMSKIDLHRYACAQEFLDDIDLVVRNALDYNPDRWLENLYKDNKTELQLIKKTGEDKLIRHRACCLRDTAYALIKAEMDTDYEHKCRQISASRRQRADSPSRFVPDFIRGKPTVTFAADAEVAPAAAQAESPMAASKEPTTPTSAPDPAPTAPSSLPPNGVPKRAWVGRNSAGIRSVRRRNGASSWSRGYVRKPKAVKRILQPIKIAPAELQGGVDGAVPVVNGLDSESTLLVVDLPTVACVAGVDVAGQAETEMATGDAGPTCNGFGPEEGGSHVDAETPVRGTPKGESGDGPVSSPQREKDLFDVDAATVPVEASTSPAATKNASPKTSPAAEKMDVSDSCVQSSGIEEPVKILTEVTVDRAALASLLARAVRVTAESDVETLLDIRARLAKHVAAFARALDRQALPKLLADELDRFENLTAASPSH